MDFGRFSSFLEQIVNYILVRADCFTVPTDLDRVAAYLNVTEVCKRPIAAEGYVEQVEGGKYRIVLRVDRGFERQRFSLAHELGHVILHKLKTGDGAPLIRQYRACVSVTDGLDEESIADRIAGLLLLPPWALTQRLSSDFGLRAIVKLASTAKASIPTALIRAMWHTTTPCVAFHLRSFRGKDDVRCLWATSTRSSPVVKHTSLIEALGQGTIAELMETPRGNGFCERLLEGNFWKVDFYRRSFYEKETIYGLARYRGDCGGRLFDDMISHAPEQFVTDSIDDQCWYLSGQ